MKYPALTADQVEAMRRKFGDVVDVDAELRAARDYAENFHTGRPYKNFGRFCWNWLRTAEERRLARMPRRDREVIEKRRTQVPEAQAPASEFPPLSRHQLEAIVNDEREPDYMRDLAREQLARTKP